MNLCDICKKRNTCSIKEKIKLEALKASNDISENFQVDIAINKCSAFKKAPKAQVECEYFCSYCIHKTTCDLWDQICNIDEEFIKEAFEYDSEIQSVCSTVSYCRKFTPIKNKKEE